MRAMIDLDDDLRDLVIAGRTVHDHLTHTLARAGFEVCEGAEVRIDARYVALSSASLAAMRGSGDLIPPAEAAHELRTTQGLARAERAVRAHHIAELEAAGVRIIDPARLTVDTTVIAEPGSTLWPDSVLLGSTLVEAGAEVRSGCWLQDTHVGAEAIIKPHSVCEGARIGPRSQVGPMAHLRPGAVLVGDNKVGNFVEMKKATLHEGAKASHLTYLGDAEIGANANIGAGTITCNYDGFRKHRTVIGERAFIGSNSALVAPIEIGAGAVVGAGSTLSRDVPEDALAVVRGDTRILKGKGKALNERNARLKRMEAQAAAAESDPAGGE